MGMATCTQASGISVVFLKVLYAIRLGKQTIKSASRPLLGHLSSCVPSILRCFGPKYGQICKELPKRHKLLVLGVTDDVLRMLSISKQSAVFSH
jgi:hypothetical protein